MKKILALAIFISASGVQALTHKHPGQNNGTLKDQPSKPVGGNEIQEEEDFSDMSEDDRREDRRKKAYDKEMKDSQQSNKILRPGTKKVLP